VTPLRSRTSLLGLGSRSAPIARPGQPHERRPRREAMMCAARPRAPRRVSARTVTSSLGSDGEEPSPPNSHTVAEKRHGRCRVTCMMKPSPTLATPPSLSGPTRKRAEIEELIVEPRGAPNSPRYGSPSADPRRMSRSDEVGHAHGAGCAISLLISRLPLFRRPKRANWTRSRAGAGDRPGRCRRARADRDRSGDRATPGEPCDLESLRGPARAPGACVPPLRGAPEAPGIGASAVSVPG
jgi:hypothetical protein